MEPMPKMSRAEYLAVMRKKMEAMLGQVADAINNAPDGYVIAGSEEKVRDLFAELRQQAFETGLQMRVDAAEAAFSPSEAPADQQEPAP
jgi:acyl transferase domain-containing protein